MDGITNTLTDYLKGLSLQVRDLTHWFALFPNDRIKSVENKHTQTKKNITMKTLYYSVPGRIEREAIVPAIREVYFG